MASMIKELSMSEIVGRLCQLGVGVVVLIAGLQHWSNQFYFLGSVFDYQLVPIWLAQIVAAIFPAVETSVGILLIIDGSRFATLCGIALGVLFVSVQGQAMVRGLKIDCGCFGQLVQRPLGMSSMAIAICLVVAGSIALTCNIINRKALQ
jgi:putative oxidoreductase